MISLLWYSVSQKPIIDMEGTFFMGEPTKIKLIKRKCKHFGTLDMAVLAEVQFGPMAVA